jgi:hypothetical protein
MSQGVLLFASNNGMVNYVKQAYFLALRIRKYLDLPTSIVTDVDIKNKFPQYVDAFDQIISSKTVINQYSNKRYYDGTLSHRVLPFQNGNRATAYELTPYTETLVMDTDYIISNDILLNCFSQQQDLLLYNDAVHVGAIQSAPEFEFISDTSVKFYWATVFFFRKTEQNKIFFDLVNHIKDNYLHYRSIYQFSTTVFRNDFAFSIAIHIINGYQIGNFVGTLPGKKFYSIDKDVLHSIKDDEITLLVEKPNRLGEYLSVKLKGSNVHVMNKFSLERVIDNQ